MTILGGIFLYAGLAVTLAGVLSILIPLRFLRIRTRKQGLLTLIFGLLLFGAGVYMPVTETRVEPARTHFDEFMPAFQFREFHSVTVGASKERVDRAIREVCPEEVRFFNTLIRIRGLKALPEGRPMLQGFTTGWWQSLANEPGREIVFGFGGGTRIAKTPEEFKALGQPPLIRMAMNFRIQELDADHCILTTETRVFAEGTHLLRGFATYWRMIYPGSSLIRYMWLRAIKLRAEREPSSTLLRTATYSVSGQQL
jgi:hypothetical protein